MSRQKLRDDNECQNCGHTVDKIYCPNCGQKNTETRQSFWHLFTHFIEDLTHYDGAFWRTIKYLLFKPAKLTKEYLEGKRMAYVPPVKLYIFISFITFFLPAILPDLSEGGDTAGDILVLESDQDSIAEKGQPRLDEMEMVYPDVWNTEAIENPMTYTSIREMDSIESLKPDSLKLGTIDYKMAKHVIKLYKHNTPERVGEKFRYAFINSIPKVVFLYMPIFAFWLWLLHGKKRWYFFDHGIFTLHYFSFLLLTITTTILISYIAVAIDKSLDYSVPLIVFLGFTVLIWQVYYFYRAHRKMYHESWLMNFTKSSILFWINLISIVIFLLYSSFVTFYNLH